MANRYWVGGSGAWDGTNTANWASTSGGTGGASVPTSADDVFFDSNSGTGFWVASVYAGNLGAKSVDCTGCTGSIGGNNFDPLTVSGNVTLSSGMGSATGTLPIKFIATATLTSAGKSLWSVEVDGSGITLTLADNASLWNFTLTQGSLSLANNTLTLTNSFSSSNSNTRSISFGSGNIALTKTSSGTILSMYTATNFSWTGTGGFTRNQVAPATVSFGITGGTTSNAPNLTVNAGSSTLTIDSGSFFKNVDFTGSSCSVAGSLNACGNLTLATGGTYTSLYPSFRASATVTTAGRTLNSTSISSAGITVTLADAMTLTIYSIFSLSAGTLNLNNFNLSTGSFSSNNSFVRSISFGSGNINLTNDIIYTVILDMATATNFTWTGTGGFTRSGVNTATISFGSTAGGSASNAPNFSSSAGPFDTEITFNSYLKNVILSGTADLSGTYFACGNLTLSSGATSFLTLNPKFISSATITSNGKALGTTTVDGSGITVTLADDMTVGSAGGSTTLLTLTRGTFNAAGFNVTAGGFQSSNTNTRTLSMGSGTWTITYNGTPGTTAWLTATTTNLTLNPGTSTISFVTASSQIFSGGGLTYYNINQAGAGALVINGSNTFNNITNSVQPATVTFTSGTTQTVSNFGLSGTSGNLVTINSTTLGSRANLSKASGVISAQYLSIKDSNATGGATWYALNSTDLGNNAGWFIGGGNMLAFFS